MSVILLLALIPYPGIKADSRVTAAVGSADGTEADGREADGLLSYAKYLAKHEGAGAPQDSHCTRYGS